MKKLVVVLVSLGLMSVANADEVARGLADGLNSVNTTQEFFPSLLVNTEGDTGYLSVVIDEVITRSGMPIPDMNAPLGVRVVLNSTCSFTPAGLYGDASLGVRVVETEAEYVNDEELKAKVVMLMGDPSTPSVLECSYDVSLDDANEHGQSVFSIEYMIERELMNGAFKFDIDAHQFMLDTSVAA